MYTMNSFNRIEVNDIMSFFRAISKIMQSDPKSNQKFLINASPNFCQVIFKSYINFEF